MPTFQPFRALRYDLDRLDPADVTAPPYDVLDAAERAELVARHPANVAVVDLPVPPGADPGPAGDPYARAAATFAAWRADGTVVEDGAPTFTAYRMTHVGEDGATRRTTGVLGALTLAAPGQAPVGGQPILPHEQTTPKAKSDRLDLLRATGVQLSPIWGLSPAAGLTALLEAGDEPVTAWVDGEGVTHEVWAITDPERLAAIAEAVSGAPVVIADGHHRYETSLAYRDERRAADGDGPWDAVATYVVELAPDQLTVLPIHRLVRGLPPGLDVAAAVADRFEVAPGVAGAEGITLVTSAGSWALVPRPGAFDGVRDLDSSRLDAALAALPDHEVAYQHGVANVTGAVTGGGWQAGFLLRPATVDQILDIAHGGERMPPKTTFFHPKPRTGVVFRSAS